MPLEIDFLCLGCDFVQATTFGGSNIDPTAWEDKKCKGESRFPAQVECGLVNNNCKALCFLFPFFFFGIYGRCMIC